MNKTSLTQSFFSKSLYIRQLKNTKLAGVGICVIFAITSFISTYISVPENNTRIFTSNILLLLPVILAIYSFSFLWKRSESDFYHALPQKRICVFNCIVASNSTWTLFAFILSFSSGAIAFLLKGVSIPFSENILQFFGLFVACLSICAGATLLATLSETITKCVMYTLFVLPSPLCIASFFSEMTVLYNPTLIPDSTMLSVISRKTFGLYHALYSTDFSLMTILLLVAKILMLYIISAFIFVRRESEVAENPTHYKKAHVFFVVLISIAFLYSIYEAFVFDIFPLFIGMLLIFLFDLVIFKKADIAVKAIGYFWIAVLCLIPMQLITVGIGTIYTKNVPTAEEIEKVTISLYEYADPLDEYTELLVTGSDYTPFAKTLTTDDIYDGLSTDDAEVKEIVANGLPKHLTTDTINQQYSQILKISLKNGKEIVRKIYFNKAQYMTFITSIKGEEENAPLFTLPEYKDVSDFRVDYNVQHVSDYENSLVVTNNVAGDMEILYNTFKEEYNSLAPDKITECMAQIKYGTLIVKITTNSRYEYLAISSRHFPKTVQMYYNSYSKSTKEYAEKFISEISDLNNETKALYFRRADEYYYKTSDRDYEIARITTPHENITHLLTVMKSENLSDTTDVSKLYYLYWQDSTDIYVLALDQNVISLLNSFT